MQLKFWDRKNKIHVDKGNFIELGKIENLELKIRGKNNHVYIVDNHHGSINICIYGDNNTVIIKTDSCLDVKVNIGDKGELCREACMTVDKGTGIGEAYFKIKENGSSIKIGKNCLLAFNIVIWCTDAHSICDKDGQVINIGKNIEIGNHVWIGRNCFITKNTKIADNSVVGWCSNVTRKFEEPNVIIAGNPAQIVKRNISWRRECPQILLDKQQNTE